MLSGEGKYHWSEVKFSGKVPSVRAEHATAVFSNRIIVVGGRDFHGCPSTSCAANGIEHALNILGRAKNDLYELDLSTMEWRALQASGDPPSPRYGHAVVIVGNKMLLYGGTDGASTFGDLYVLDLGTAAFNNSAISSNFND